MNATQIKEQAINFIFSKSGALAIAGAALILGIIAPNWVHLPSVAIVVGGTLLAVTVQTSPKEVKSALNAAKDALLADERAQEAPLARIRTLVGIAHRAKQKGIISLDAEAEKTDDPFFKLALEIAVDGQSEQEIRRILDTESEFSHQKASKSYEIFESLGSYSPSFGLIGTVLGLVGMLRQLGNAEAMGPAMALALLTTLYGAVVANVFCFPVAGKLKQLLNIDLITKRITTEAIVSMRKEESVMSLEQRLKSFLPAVVNN